MKESTRKYLGFNDTWLWLIGVPLLTFAMPFLFSGATFDLPVQSLAVYWCISFTMTSLYWMGSRSIMIFWRKRMPGIDKIISRLAFQLVSVFVYSFLVGQAIRILLFMTLPFEYSTESAVSDIAGAYLVIYLMVAIYEAIYLYQKWKSALLEQERVKQEHIRTQLEGLRSQVNPHFLFNSLNTLMNLVTEDQQQAVKYLQRMSSVFRHVLENRKEQLVLLEEEMKFIEDYIFLQKERFRENLVVDINIPHETIHHAIVPLSIQILLENAIKHNTISEKRPLTIKIRVNDEGKLEVSNNLQRKNQAMPSTKLGLENIKDRYKFFTDEKVDIIETGEIFSVAIPLLPVGQKIKDAIPDY